jgi:hypothetical protein
MFKDEAGKHEIPDHLENTPYSTFKRHLSAGPVRCLDWDFCHPLINVILREADSPSSFARTLGLPVGTLGEWKTFHGYAQLHQKIEPPCGYREDLARPTASPATKEQKLVNQRIRARILSAVGVIQTVKGIYPNYELVHLWDVDHPICAFKAPSSEHSNLEAALASTPPQGARLPGRRELPLKIFYPKAPDRLEKLNLRFDRATDVEKRSFFPGSTFALQRLWFSDEGAPRLDCKLGRYFTSIATSEDLDPELMKALRTNPDRPVELSDLDHRRWLHRSVRDGGPDRDPVVDGSTRAAAISHATTVLVAQGEGSYDLWLPIRSDDVETHAFFNHVAPSGIFSPHEERDYPSVAECSVERNFFREWAEELYAQDAHERPPWINAPDPAAAPEVIRLKEALDDASVAELIYTGVSVNLLTLRPEICLALIIHDPTWLDNEMQVAEDFGRPMRLGWEYTTRQSVRTLSRDQSDNDWRIRIDAPTFEPTNEHKYDRGFLVPNAAAAIHLALGVLASRHA